MVLLRQPRVVMSLWTNITKKHN